MSQLNIGACNGSSIGKTNTQKTSIWLPPVNHKSQPANEQEANVHNEKNTNIMVKKCPQINPHKYYLDMTFFLNLEEENIHQLVILQYCRHRFYTDF